MANVRKYTVPDRYVKTKADRLALDRGCTFDITRGERVVQFCEEYVRPTRGFGAGQPVKLLPWQSEDLLIPLFSWVKPDGTRRFRDACLFVPRQNGKSFICSCIALYMLMADGEEGAYCVIAGVNGEQTKVVFDEVLNSRNGSPKLVKATHARPSTRELLYPKKNGRLKGLSNEGYGKLGNPHHCAVLDEFAFWQDYTVYEALKYGTSSRKQPLTLAISTSGTDRTTPAYSMWQYGQAILDGGCTDTAFFPLIYAAKPEDPIHAPETWKKCNPSIGASLQTDEIETWSERAKRSKVEELQFRQYRLNEWCSSVNQHLDLDAFHRCRVEEFPDLTGKTAYLSADLSTTTDLSSVVCVIPHDGKWWIDHHSFCCRAGVERSEAQNLVKYSLFEAEGDLTVHTGNCVDLDDIRAYIRKKCTEYRVKTIAIDPSHNAADTLIMLQSEGYPVEQYRSGPLYFNMPMRRLAELVMQEKIRWKPSSLLAWQAQNLEARKDHRDMLQPHKPAQDAKIDTLVALLMALSKCLTGEAVPVQQTYNKIEWWSFTPLVPYILHEVFRQIMG